MGMANPFMTAGTSAIATKSAALPEFKEFDWDFDKNKFLYDEYGNHIIKTRNEGLKIWIRKALLVQRYRYRAYFDDYGCEIEDKFIGKMPNDTLSKNELFTYISEALLVNPYIKNVYLVSTEQEKKKITLSIDVKTIYGETTVKIEV